MKYFISIVISILCFNSVSSQKIDSISSLLAKEETVDKKIDLLIQLSEALVETKEYDLSLAATRQALNLIPSSRIGENQAKAYWLGGRALYFKAEYDSAVFYLKKGIQIAEDIKKEDLILLKLYNVLGSTYRKKEAYRDAIDVFNKGINNAITIGDKKILKSLYNNLGNAYDDIDLNEKAIDSYLKSLKLKREIGDSLGVAASLNNMGNIYMEQQKLEEAIKLMVQALDIYKEKENIKGVTTGLINLGVIHKIAGNIDKAIEYYQEAQGYCKEYKFRNEEAVILQNLGNIYGNTGNHSRSISYQLEAEKIYKELNRQKSVGEVNLNIGIEYFEINDFKKAAQYLRKALKIAKDIESPYDIANASMELGNTYSKDGKFTEAFPFLNQGKLKAKEAGSLFLEMYASLYLSQHFQRRGDYKQALSSYEDYMKLSVQMENQRNKDQLNKIQAQYDWELQEKEIKVLSQENKIKEIELDKASLVRNFFIGFTGLLSLVVIGVIWSNRTISKAKQKTEDLLLNILPVETAEELKLKGNVDARKFEEVTVLFTDFKEFSLLSEKVDPEILVKSVDVYFKKFDEITTRYGLEKIKTIGDSYMCAGGLPTETKTHVKDVVNAAIEMISFVKERAIIESELLNFEIRIGINTGPVVAGIVGIKKWQYDIWGNTVNIAARMESNSLPGRINVSESTYQKIKDEYNCEYRGKIDIKKQGSFNMYFVN